MLLFTDIRCLGVLQTFLHQVFSIDPTFIILILSFIFDIFPHDVLSAKPFLLDLLLNSNYLFFFFLTLFILCRLLYDICLYSASTPNRVYFLSCFYFVLSIFFLLGSLKSGGGGIKI